MKITTPIALREKTYERKIHRIIKFTIEDNITAKRFYTLDLILRIQKARNNTSIIEKENTIEKPDNRSNVIKYITKNK